MQTNTFDKAFELSRRIVRLERDRAFIETVQWLNTICDHARVEVLLTKPEDAPAHIRQFQTKCLDLIDTEIAVLKQEFERL